MLEGFDIFEILFLLCFAVSWPISIIKAIRTKIVIGKSPVFMCLIILGYMFGILHKQYHDYDIVTYLYLFNAVLVLTDLNLYFHYIKQNRRDLADKKKEEEKEKENN